MERDPGIKTRAATAALAALAALVCYLNTIPNRFVFDDIRIVVENPMVTDPSIGIAERFTSHYWDHVTPSGNLYRPLTIESYALNHRVHGLDPRGFHLVNILLHAACSALVVLLAFRLGLPAGGAAAAGVLFASHPIHTEAVAGIVGRAELMAAAAVLSAWVAHLGRPRPLRVVGIPLLYLAGLLSKENAVVLPALLAVGDMMPARRGRLAWRSAIPVYLGCLLVLAAWLSARALLMDPVEPGSISDSPFAGVPALQRILTALEVQGRYLWLLLAPLGLSADYSFGQIPLVTSAADPGVLAAAASLVLLLALGVMSLRRGRLEGVCALGYLAAMAPVSNLFLPIGTVMAERLLYLPSVAFCMALPALWRGALGDRIRAGRAAVAATCALTVLYAALTIDRNRDWKDQLTLFTATVETSPLSAKAHFNLGVALEESGRPQEALGHYLAAVEILPEMAGAHHNAGLLLASMDRPEEALPRLEQAATLDPSLPGVFGSLGALHARLGRPEEAEAALRRGIARDPGDHAAPYNLGTLLLTLGRAAEAVAALETARGIDPADPDGRYQLGIAYRQAGRPREALEEFRRTLEIAPGLAETHIEIARAWMQIGNREEASREVEIALRLGLTLPPDLRGTGLPP